MTGLNQHDQLAIIEPVGCVVAIAHLVVTQPKGAIRSLCRPSSSFVIDQHCFLVVIRDATKDCVLRITILVKQMKGPVTLVDLLSYPPITHAVATYLRSFEFDHDKKHHNLPLLYLSSPGSSGAYMKRAFTPTQESPLSPLRSLSQTCRAASDATRPFIYDAIGITLSDMHLLYLFPESTIRMIK